MVNGEYRISYSNRFKRFQIIVCVQYICIISKSIEVEFRGNTVHVINIELQKQRPYYRPLRNTKKYFPLARKASFNLSSLDPISQIRREPIIDNSTHTVVTQFAQQYSIVNCVECLFQINKYAARVENGVHITLYSVDNIQNCVLSRAVCSETILCITKNVVFFGKGCEAFMHQSFEQSIEHRQ